MKKRFIYYQCPECQFNCILDRSFDKTWCALCFLDTRHEVTMTMRPARNSDQVEGTDQRTFYAKRA